jgi:plastocyanin
MTMTDGITTDRRAGLDIGDGWRRVAAISAATWLVWAIGFSIIIQAIEPFILIFAVVPLAAWGVTVWKPGKASYTTFGALGLITIILNLPFLIGDLSHPESALSFNIGTVALLAAVLQTLVGVRVWVSLSEHLARRSWQTAAVLFIVGLAISLVATMSLEDDVAQAGDTMVRAHDVQFLPGSFTAAAGTAVFIENQDPTRHTFTIEALGIDVELPANTARRVEIPAPAGTYEVICAVPGHDNMKATLTISG